MLICEDIVRHAMSRYICSLVRCGLQCKGIYVHGYVVDAWMQCKGIYVHEYVVDV